MPSIENAALRPLLIRDEALTCTQLASDYLPPQAFISSDSWSRIQDANNVPLIFH